MKKYHSLKLVLLMLVTINLALEGQDLKLKIDRKDFKTDREEGYREAWDHIKTAEDLYRSGRGMFPEALDHYLEAYEYNQAVASLNYKIGVCYLFTDEKHESVQFLKQAYLQDNKVTADIRFMLARAYHMTLEFDQAIENYTEYKNELSDRDQSQYGPVLDKRIRECRHGKELVSEPVRVIITNMGESINSQSDDYYPVFSSDESTLYFTSRRRHSDKAKRSKSDHEYYEDVYVSERRGDDWSNARYLGKPVNHLKKNIAAVGLSPDGRNLFIHRGDQNRGDLYVSERKGDSWSSPKSMPRFNSKYRETGLTISSDNELIYLISSNEKDSHGGKDIFMSNRGRKNKWEEPVNAGDVLNTSYDEEGVHISADGNTLYFSSKGHNSMGGYDVFMSEKNELGEWTKPVNLGYPINTPDDELFYTVSQGGKYAYFSSKRLGSLGGSDLFRIFYLGAEKEMVMGYREITAAGSQIKEKTGFFSPPELLSIDTSYVLTGRVYDSESLEGIRAKLDFIDTEESRVIATTIATDSGTYRAVLPEGKAYGVEIVASDYLLFLDAIDLTDQSADEELIFDFGLEQVVVGATVVLENIFFETGKTTLKPESYPLLDQVVKFMESNPGLRMEISGHTDNTGSLKFNTDISQERAQAVVAYLVENGVDASRLDAKGYAFSQPIAPNDTPEGRARNRRVEFKILSK